MTTWTIAQIKSLTDPVEVCAAVRSYDEQVAAKQAEAHDLRDRAILKLLTREGPTTVARKTGMSVSHVKLVKQIGRRR